MEGGLDLNCVHDGLAVVQVGVVLRHLSGSDWVVEATVPVDLGHLDQVTADLRRLLAITEP